MNANDRGPKILFGALVLVLLIGTLLGGGMMGPGAMGSGMMWGYGGTQPSGPGWMWGLTMGFGMLLMVTRRLAEAWDQQKTRRWRGYDFGANVRTGAGSGPLNHGFAPQPMQLCPWP